MAPGPVIPQQQREAISVHLRAVVASCTTAALAAMDERHEWFHRLDPDHRSWITMVARSGIDGFVAWFSGSEDISPMGVFEAAPRLLMRKVSLQHTVELVRTTIEVFESKITELFSEDEQAILAPSMLLYSREIAFAAASVYAHAAEVRGAWDARMETLVIDAIMRDETDDTVISRASTLGWRSAENVAVVMGPASPDADLDAVRRSMTRSGSDVLIASQGDRLVMVLGGAHLVDDAAALRITATTMSLFAPGPVVVGPVVDHLMDATESAQAALSALNSCPANVQSPVSATDLLPERVLSGDTAAKKTMLAAIYRPLVDAGGDLLATLTSFFDHGGSVEGTARALFVHPNTVRYRLKRIQEVTGYSPTVARDNYVLHISVSVGQLATQK